MAKQSKQTIARTSAPIIDEQLECLQKCFPEAFTENKVDFEKLRDTLGDVVEERPDRYSFTWAGKKDAIRILQTPSRATLIPNVEESVKFDESENLFIEGDNLEVLKLLQKSYFGRVKMIYIDPPYNTGNDFIYPDNYSDPLDTYLQLSGQKDEEGNLLTSNPETNGRYHSSWLSMMYPRLFLARQLLRDDGVIFVSIDDHEVNNLRTIMNEIFGEENFEGHVHWRRRYNQPNDPTKMIGLVAEHIIVFARDSKALKANGVGKVGLTGSFSNPDNDPRGDWASKPWKVGSDQSGSRYLIKTPTGKVCDEEWMGDENTYQQLFKDNRIIFPDNGKGSPRKKYFKSEREQEGQCANNWWNHDTFGHNQGANDEVEELMGMRNVFSNPKPTLLVKNMFSIANVKPKDIVLDFFAGSCPTAHAGLIYDNNLRIISVQIPEPLDPSNNGQGVSYDFCVQNKLATNIASIGKERIRRAISKLDSKEGFKVFKLTESNFRPWIPPEKRDAEALGEQMGAFNDPLIEGWKQDNVLYEVAIKEGFSLYITIEKVHLVKDLTVQEVTDPDREQKFYLCLDEKIDLTALEPLKLTRDDLFICRDSALNDNTAANLALQCRLKTI